MIVTKLSPHSVQLEWRPPLDDGGDVIRGYVIEMTEGIGQWRKVGYANNKETAFTIAGKCVIILMAAGEKLNERQMYVICFVYMFSVN